MPTLNQMRNAIDTFVTNKWPTIVARQENYRTNRGQYWQGLRTHLVDPAHTSSTDGSALADQLNQAPADAFQNWANVFPEWVPELLPACVWVDAYDSPEGKGWVLNIRATHNGTIWQRSVNVGPQSWRTSAWRQVPPPPGN
jgi:hypothetical protein